MPPKTSPAVTRSKTPARQVTPAFAAAPAPQPQPEQVYAGLFGGGPAFGTNLGNLSGSGYGRGRPLLGVDVNKVIMSKFCGVALRQR